ncbi:MAG: carbohydrate ABC transporter permease [Saccharofermentanales bacterium]
MILVPSTVLQLTAVFLAGYGLARVRFPGRGLLFGLLLFTIIVPVQSYIVPLFVNMKNFDIFGIGNVIGLITGKKLTINLLGTNTAFYIQALFGMGIRSGLCIFIVRQFFRGMPIEFEEAAMIDGCGPVRTFISVMLPNAVSIMATITVFSVVWYWNDFSISSVFFSADFPLAVNLTTLRSSLSASSQALQGIAGVSGQQIVLLKEPILACGCLLTIFPLVLFYVFAQKYFVEGAERSGIVG